MAYIGNDVDAIFIPSSVNTSTDLRINGGALTQTGGDVNLDGGTFFLDESANRVGIGTITPGVTLDVVGTIRATNINALDLSVEDKNIVIGDVASPTNTPADGGGVTLKGAVDKTIAWLNATAAWTFSEHISIASAKEYRIAGTKVLDATSLGSAVVSSSLTSVGTIATGVWNGSVIGKVYLDATVVSTGDTGTVTSTMILNGTILDADINASAGIVDTKLATIATAGKVSNSATTATNANTASAIVARDESGNFSAGTITAALTGAASSNVLKAGDTMTGALVMPLGVFGTPSLTFTDDLNTGIYSPGADQLAVATNGTGKLFVNSTGDLGVNTGGTQGTKLHVIGGNVWSSNFYEVARFQKSSGTAVSLGFDNTAYVATIGAYSHDGTASNLSFWTYPGSGSVQERLRITSGGLVGIGTSAPGAPLNVRFDNAGTTTVALFENQRSVGGSPDAAQIVVGARGYNHTIIRQNSDLGTQAIGTTLDTVISNTWGAALHIATGSPTNAARLTVTSAGLVGIGAPSPDAKLHVATGGVGTIAIFQGATGRALYAGTDGSGHYVEAVGTQASERILRLQVFDGGGGYAQLFIDGANKYLYTSSNMNVGIGTPTPTYKLHVNGSFAATTKSFVIPHPTKEGYKLQHGSLEGPENGVYVRGRSGSGVIKLPEYWAGLIDPSSITATLTPIGQNASLWVERIESNKIYIGREDPSVAYFYMVNAERIDVEPLKVEIPNPS